MSSEENHGREGTKRRYRRRFLRSVGATGIAGVLAGCLGGDDGDDGENGDGGDDGNADDGGDTEPAAFEVSGLDPAEVSVTRDQRVDVGATVENAGEEEGTQDVRLRVDGDVVDSTELVLGGGDAEEVSLSIDAADLEGGEHAHAVVTDDDEQSGTLVVEAAVEALTYNIRYDNPNDEYSWDDRREHVVELIEDADPDVIGVQEALPHVYDHLQEDLPAYEWYAVPRDGDGEGEAVPVGWRSDRYEAIETDTFWLSETPDEQSQGWDAALPRVVSWAELEDASTGNRFWFANAHFDHVGEEARLESAKLLRERAEERLGDGQRCIVLGDFNYAPDEEPYEEMTRNELVDSREIAEEVEGPEGTHLGDQFLENPDESSGEPDSDRRIDHVYVPEGAPVEYYHAIPEDLDEGYRSDHLPVFVRIDSYSLEG